MLCRGGIMRCWCAVWTFDAGVINAPGSRSLFAVPDLALYDRTVADQSVTLAAGPMGELSMYGATEKGRASQ